jgi:hypothetical protein
LTVANASGVAADGVGTAVADGLRVGDTVGLGDALWLGDGLLDGERLGVARACSGTHPMTTAAVTTASAAPVTAIALRERVKRMPFSVNARIANVDERAAKLVSTWLDGLSPEGRRTLYTLLDELCSGLDVSRHNPFGFLRLRAEFETSGELFGCTLPELRDAVAASLGSHLPPDRPRSALESLRDEISSRGHPDFR